MAASQQESAPPQRYPAPSSALSVAASDDSDSADTTPSSHGAMPASFSPTSAPEWRTLAYAAVVITLGTANQIAGKVRSKPLGRFDYFVSLCNAFLYFFVYSIALLVFYRWKMVSRANLAFVWPSLFAAHSPSSRVSPYSQAGPAANSCPSRRASSSSAAASLSAEGADASRHEEGAGASSSRLVVWPTCLSSPLLPASQAPLSPRYFGAWRYFVVTGFCDACGNILGFIAQPFVPGPLFSLATQAIVPFSCLCSMLLLKRRYSLAQVGALLLVTAGFFVAWYPLVVPHVHRTGRWSFLNGLSRLRAERLSGKTGGALLDTNAPLHLLKRTETGETGGMGARRHTEEGEIVQRAFSNVEEAEREPAVWAGPREENKRRRSAGALMEDARVMQLGEKQGRACSFSTSVPSYVFEIFPYDPSVQLPPRVPGSRACSIAGAHRTSTPVLPSSSFPLAPTLARPSSSGYTLPSPLSDHSLSVFLRPFEQLVHAAYGPPGRPALVATGTGDGLVLSEGGPAEFQQRAMLDTEQPSRGARPRNAEWRDSAAPEKEESRQVGVPEEIRVKAERAGEEIGHEDKETNPQVTFKEAGEGGNLANDYEQRQRRQMEPRGPTESQQNHRAFWLFAEPPPRRAYSGAAGGVVRTKEGGLDKGQRGEDSLLARKLITGTAPSSETGENKVHTKPRPAGGDGVVEDNEYKRGSEGQSRTDVGPAGLLEAGQREQARGDSQSPGEPQRGTHPYVLDRVMGQTEEETVRKPALYLAASAARGDGKSALLVPSAGVGWYEHGAAPENPEPTPSEGRPRTGFEPDGEGEKELLESRPFEGKAAEAFSGERKAPGLRGPEPAKGVWSDVLEETAPRSESESEGPAVWLYTLLVAVSTLPTALSFAIKEKLLRDFEEKHGWASGPANGARGNTFFVPSEDGTMRTVRAVGSATLVYTGDEADTEEQSGGEGAGREGCSRTDEEGLVEENLALASEGMEGCGAVGLLSLAERRNKDIRVRRSLLQTSWFPEGEGSEETASVREGQEKDVSACAGDQGQRSVARGLTRSRRNSSGAAGEAGLREAAGDARGLSREGGETNKERLHVLVLCAHGSAFQLMWVLLSIPLSVCAGQTGDESLGSYLSAGARCFLGWTEDSPAPLCRYAPEAYSVYALVNVAFNLSLIGFVSVASSLLTFVCMKATLPLSILLYAAFPWPLLDPHDVQVTSDTVISLLMILFGVIWFHRESERNRTVFVPSGNPTCCWPLSLSALRYWLARAGSARSALPQ